MDDDDTISVLAALRRLVTEPAEEEPDEEIVRRTVARPREQVALAIAILREQRPWRIEDRRALGLPQSADAGDWHATVARRLGEIDPVLIVEGWATSMEGEASWSAFQRAIDALGQLPAMESIAKQIADALQEPSNKMRLLASDARREGESVDRAALGALRDILMARETRRDLAAHAIRIAATYAQRDPLAAGLIALRIRANDGLLREDALRYRPSETGEEGRALRSAVLAEAVVESGCRSLGPTVMLELERERMETSLPDWARALVAVLGDAGHAHLARMRGRPGWSALPDRKRTRFAFTLEGLTSPIADERKAALEALACAPDPHHLQAFLLAIELDAHIARSLDKTRWTFPAPTAWMPLLAAYCGPTHPIDRLIAVLPREMAFRGQLEVLRTEELIDLLVVAGVANARMPIHQELSLGLRQLAEEGVEVFAPRVWTPPLSPDELAALDAAEAAVIESTLVNV